MPLCHRPRVLGRRGQSDLTGGLWASGGPRRVPLGHPPAAHAPSLRFRAAPPPPQARLCGPRYGPRPLPRLRLCQHPRGAVSADDRAHRLGGMAAPTSLSEKGGARSQAGCRVRTPRATAQRLQRAPRGRAQASLGHSVVTPEGLLGPEGICLIRFWTYQRLPFTEETQTLVLAAV